MAIIPDDIKNLEGQEPQRKQNIIYEYIKYMREQIEFWAQNRIKDITSLFTRVDDLDANTAKKSGDTFTGNVKIQTNNPNTSQGWSNLTVGSDKPTGTAQNSRGQIYIYGNGSNYTIVRAPYSTADRQCDFPDATGTIALNENTFKYKGYLPSGANLNDMIGVDKVGIWFIQDSVVNGPGVTWCALYNGVPAYGQQMIVTSAYIFTRSYTGSPAAWTGWNRYNSNPVSNSSSTPLTVTRINNNFVNADSLARVFAFRKGGMLWCNFNLAITGTGTFTDFIQIGTISGWNAISSTYFNIPGQNVATQTLTAYISSTGGIFIYSAQSLTSQFFRASVSAPAVD